MQTKIIGLGKRSLVVQALEAAKVVAVPAPMHHIITIDVSGSMYSDLPELRLQLKNKLASLVQEKDTVTILWFSGRGQFGVLVEELEIRSVVDLSSLNAAIDRFLRPQGMTGFKEPLEEVLNVIDRISKKRADSLFNLFFMSDGYDNVWGQSEILAVCKKLEKRLANATVVEYGWNADRVLLTKMAETLGGSLIFNKDLQEYQVTFEAEIGRGVGAKKVPVLLTNVVSDGYAFGVMGESLMTFVPDENGVVLVPEGLDAVAYFTSAKGKPFNHKTDKSALIWAAVVSLSQRMDAEGVFEALGAIGDVALVDFFSSCYSKEDYSLFQKQALEVAVKPALRYSSGYDPKAVPKEDAYTVLELLSDLSSSDKNLFYPTHEAFSYERIGAASAQKEEGVRFTYGDKSKGYPINGVVWNEDRPNVSVRVRVEGFVPLPADRPNVLPEQIPSFIYRNYTIVRDGIVHTRRLPVSLEKATFDKLQANGLLAGELWADGKVFVLEYPRLPVINRRMVRGVTAADTFAKVLELMKLKGAQKVLNEFRNRFTPKESKKFQLMYGQDATDYLAALGITDYNGFNPSSETVKSGDFYLAKELKIAGKGLSSLPKVEDVEAAIAAGKKLKVSEFVMSEAVKKVQVFLASNTYKDAADPAALAGAWIESEAKAVVTKTRLLMQELAQSKFSVVVGHAWFVDMPSLDDNSLDVELAGFGKVAVTATLKDVQIEK